MLVKRSLFENEKKKQSNFDVMVSICIIFFSKKKRKKVINIQICFFASMLQCKRICMARVKC